MIYRDLHANPDSRCGRRAAPRPGVDLSRHDHVAGVLGSPQGGLEVGLALTEDRRQPHCGRVRVRDRRRVDEHRRARHRQRQVVAVAVEDCPTGHLELRGSSWSRTQRRGIRASGALQADEACPR